MKLFKKFKEIRNKNTQLITSKNAPALAKIASQSGISWHELYYVNENRYFTVFQIVEFPESSSTNMFASINKSNFAFLSIDFEHVDSKEFADIEDKTFEKSENKKEDAKTRTQYKRAGLNQKEMERFSRYIDASKNSVKSMSVRVFVFGSTFDELQDNSKKVTNLLVKAKMRGVIQTNNLLEDYQGLTLFSNPQAQLVSSGNLADMTLSSNVNIVDYHAAVLGMTETGVYAPNPFSFKNSSYNIAFLGGMGAGKSALLKKLFKNMLIRGNYIPLIFDIHDEYDLICEVLRIPRVSYSENNNINFMALFYVESEDGMIRMNDVQTKISSIKETFKGFTGIEREQTILRLGHFLNIFYRDYIARSFDDIEHKLWGTLDEVLKAVNEEIVHIQDKNWNGKDTEGEPVVLGEYLKDLYNLQTGLQEMCNNYGYLFNRRTNIDFDLTKPLCFDISFLRNNSDAKVKASYVSLLMSYASYGVYLNLQRNQAKEIETGVKMYEREEPYFMFHLILDEFMQYAESRAFLNDVLNFLKYARKAYSGLVIVIHTTDDTQNSLAEAGDLLRATFDLITNKYVGRTGVGSAANLPKLLRGVTENDAIAVTKFVKGEKGERKFLVVDDQGRKIYFTSIVTNRERGYFKGGV
ncbi:hypothetical protein [Erysipelothrix aquatica]|uniref:hypothetical protein n=1 Tax=Erysipelothrix aquatica TaxID=2683714 RepID=UPI0013580D80|nr:hypothetical protein [Erysipelothrix aquatica]